MSSEIVILSLFEHPFKKPVTVNFPGELIEIFDVFVPSDHKYELPPLATIGILLVLQVSIFTDLSLILTTGKSFTVIVPVNVESSFAGQVPVAVTE